ncbi:MAG TPA: HPr family phosphocarrier protein [Acholeplasmataceae bacterium]|jgi:phosphocarrier protein|nr:HPr family phosphocarrier protein [Acholeplasmataceae bacterium]HPX71692.1 HPr family phosphocarrier protein [Acholeplasmataceae bacterium]HQC30699.1 HPr family phosphocarrier protein [Acholeplasmataceae bacterium]
MITKEIVISSTNGIHASLAAKVVQAASKYSVDITLHYRDRIIDLKSILGLMSLAVPYGENVKIVASGERANEAIKEITKILG